MNKKLLVAAIAGLLVSGNAAAVVLGTDDARVYAAELEDGTALTDLNDDVEFAIGYNFSPSEVRYGRFECTSNLTIDNATVTSGSADVALGAINGEGTSALFFSMTAADPIVDPAGTAAVVIDVDADNTLEDGGNVNCAFSIYDQPSQAQAGGTTGRIYTTGFQPFITRAPSFVFTGTPGTATAAVEAPNGAYTAFVTTGVFGALDFSAVGTTLNADGTPMTLAALFANTTTVSVEGDYTAATDLTWDGTPADAAPADGVATFTIDPVVDTVGDLLFVEDGNIAIQESSYTATLNADVNPGFVLGTVAPVAVGEIVRNGTQLQAPLAQVPAGWLSRMVLTNTGNVVRDYTINVMGENGNVITTANTTGTVPANGTTVVDLTTVLTGFTAAPRATLNVTVSAPNNQIQGLYQIVNPDKGSISNHVMVRPGSN